ncbi:MAG: NAD(P)H-hydrate dehydratase [Gammaproteobacteria bacterium]
MQTQLLYDAAATRAIDRAAIEQAGIPGLELMRRAGASAFGELVRRWPRARRLAVVCGGGNNGGDGFVIARLAQAEGLDVAIHFYGSAGRLGADARTCLEDATAAGLVIGGPAATLDRPDVVVDALFGTGLDRAPAGEAGAAIDAINAAGCPVLAVDVPSGLNASTGGVPGTAVRADVTVTYIAVKPGLLTGHGPALCGTLVFARLEVPPSCRASVAATAESLDYAGVVDAFPPRRATAHKGDFGHVLVVGGAPGFAGAARMAAEAAARTGAGLVSVATAPGHAAIINAGRPELMVHGVTGAAALRPLAGRASVVALGPGLGQDPWARELAAAVRDLRLPQVCDADGLNLLAADPDHDPARVLTPHPGEAARLLGCDTGRIQADRLGAARELASRYGGVTVLKGAGTVVAAADRRPVVIRGGNPGMASGGMGDVLTGVIAALVAQGRPLFEAAAIGACVHAEAADRAAREGGQRGLLAGDLAGHLRAAVNPSP